MSYKHYRMDTSSMTAEHRDELLTAISKCVGVGWHNWTGEPYIFKLTWDERYSFEELVPHASECSLTPWAFY